MPQPVAEAQPAQAESLSPEVEAAVNELMAISSKPKEECIRALTAAHGIPDVAFEFLLSGHIPEVPMGGMGGGYGGGAEGHEGADGYGEEDMADEGDEPGAEGDPLAQYNLDANTLQ